MNSDQITQAASGIDNLASAVDCSTSDILESMIGTIVSEEDAGSIREYMERNSLWT